jgi:hypothetical protein
VSNHNSPALFGIFLFVCLLPSPSPRHLITPQPRTVACPAVTSRSSRRAGIPRPSPPCYKSARPHTAIGSRGLIASQAQDTGVGAAPTARTTRARRRLLLYRRRYRRVASRSAHGASCRAPWARGGRGRSVTLRGTRRRVHGRSLGPVLCTGACPARRFDRKPLASSTAGRAGGQRGRDATPVPGGGPGRGQWWWPRQMGAGRVWQAAHQ